MLRPGSGKHRTPVKTQPAKPNSRRAKPPFSHGLGRASAPSLPTRATHRAARSLRRLSRPAQPGGLGALARPIAIATQTRSAGINTRDQREDRHAGDEQHIGQRERQQQEARAAIAERCGERPEADVAAPRRREPGLGQVGRTWRQGHGIRSPSAPWRGGWCRCEIRVHFGVTTQNGQDSPVRRRTGTSALDQLSQLIWGCSVEWSAERFARPVDARPDVSVPNGLPKRCL